MRDNIPIDDGINSSDDVIGDNVKLLIMHKAFNELISGDTMEEEKEKERRFE